jgi:raffinose/stachyose/melibiose transport system substrate-binding protein
MRIRTPWSRWMALLLVLLLVPAVAGLGRTSSTAAQDAPTIQMWFGTTGGSTVAECLIKTAIDPFNAQGGTQVEATLQANGWDATRTALAGGAGPDVVTTPGPSFAFELAQAGQLLSLDQVVTEQGWDQRFVPWALNLGKVDGQLYSIPNEVETLVLYYNKTLFEEHGWTPPKTTDELMTLSAQIQEAGLVPFAHANQEWRAANEWFVGEMMNHVAGPQKVYDALTGAAPWTDPAFVDALTKLNHMQQEGWFMGGLDRYYTTATADANAAFGNGDAAMKIEGTWWVADGHTFFGEEAGNSNDWDWVPVPSTTGDAIYDLGIGSTHSINANSEYPQETAQFLTYFHSAETQGRLAVECGRAPSPVTIPAENLSGLDPRYGAILTAMNEASAANNYGYTTWTFWPPKSDIYIYEEVEKVWAGDMTVEEYLQGLQTLFDQEKTAGDIPPIPAR